MPTKYISHVNPEDFVLIPKTKSYISVFRGCMEEPITGLNGYDEIRMVQEAGLYPTSSSEWGTSRKHFQLYSKREFNGKSGKEIEDGYKSKGVERTSTLLAFRENGDFTPDVHDMLREEGFDGKIALIDFPYVQEDEDIFIPSPRTRIVDVTDKIPLENGFIQNYDDGLGIPVKNQIPLENKLMKAESSSHYYGAYFWIEPVGGTKQIIRSGWGYTTIGGWRFNVAANWEPARTTSNSGINVRFSSERNPAEFLD